MVGSVYVMEPADYEAWLTNGGAQGSMSQRGEALFQQLGCVTCHQADGHGRCPTLVGLFGKPVEIQGGQVVTADAGYVRESILYPQAKIVAGYEPIMPTFQGQVTEEGVQQLVEYVKSIGPKDNNSSGANMPSPLTTGSQPASPQQRLTNPNAITEPKRR